MKINNVVVVSDLHCGSTLGLCQPAGIELDDGGYYKPSKFQKQVWKVWEEFWNEWVPMVCHKEPYAIVLNGDAIDGKPFQSIANFSENPTTQKRLAEQILKPQVRKAIAYYHIKGTESHVGKSGYNEEDLAYALGSIPNDIGQYARYDLWIRVGKGLVHFLHHIGTTGSQAYEATAVGKEMVDEMTESGRWHNRLPDIIVRSHRHRHISVEIPTAQGMAIAIVTAGWQLLTPFCYKIPGARISTPQIGGSVIRAGDNDLYARHFTRSLARSRIEG